MYEIQLPEYRPEDFVRSMEVTWRFISMHWRDLFV